MIIMGIDQGSTKCGYAVHMNGKINQTGTITMKGKDRYDRYHQLLDMLDSLININVPDVVAIENVFMKRSGFSNPKTSIIMGETRGIIMSLLITRGIKIMDINPSELTGFLGINTRKIDKKTAAQAYITHETGIKHGPKEEDAADAALITLIAYNKLRGHHGEETN